MQRFVLAVVVGGSLSGLGMVAEGADDLRIDAVVVALVLCTIFAEHVPIKIPRHGLVEELTCSFTFAFGLLLYAGPAAAVIALAIASAAPDLRMRKPPVRLLFNVGQYALAMLAATLVLVALTDLPSPRPLPPASHPRTCPRSSAPRPVPSWSTPASSRRCPPSSSGCRSPATCPRPRAARAHRGAHARHGACDRARLRVLAVAAAARGPADGRGPPRGQAAITDRHRACTTASPSCPTG
jgi:hypothetical protein